MTISAHQPAYLPWLGYFDKILRSDLFIFLDSIQFEKNSFTNRNMIKSSNGAIWLTVPVKTKDHFELKLNEIVIDNKKNWKDKHLKSIYFNYKKAVNFEYNFPKIEKLYSNNYEFLSDLCFEHLIFWLEEFNIKTKIIPSSKLNIKSNKSDLVLELCLKFNANNYLSGILGKNYLEEENFKRHNIEVEYQKFETPFYEQLYGEFIPNLSIIDVWMNSDIKSILNFERYKQ